MGVETMILEGKTLKTALQGLLLAAGRDDARPHLQGVLFAQNSAGNLRLVATDGHRLHLVQFGAEYDFTDPDVGEKALVPVDAVKRLAQVLEKGHVDVRFETMLACDVTVSTNQGGANAWCGIDNGLQFPPWQKVAAAPKGEPDPERGLDVSYLLDAAKFVKGLTSKGKSAAFPSRLTASHALDPIHLGHWDKGLQVHSLAVVMPCRI